MAARPWFPKMPWSPAAEPALHRPPPDLCGEGKSLPSLRKSSYLGTIPIPAAPGLILALASVQRAEVAAGSRPQRTRHRAPSVRSDSTCGSADFRAWGHLSRPPGQGRGQSLLHAGEPGLGVAAPALTDSSVSVWSRRRDSSCCGQARCANEAATPGARGRFSGSMRIISA